MLSNRLLSSVASVKPNVHNIATLFGGSNEYAPGTFDELWNVSGVDVSTDVSSRIVTIIDITAGTVITDVTGTTHSVNGVEGVSTIDPGDSLMVTATASSEYLTLYTGGVVVGGVTCQFSVTTRAEPSTAIDEMLQTEIDGLLQSDIDNLQQYEA